MRLHPLLLSAALVCSWLASASGARAQVPAARHTFASGEQTFLLDGEAHDFAWVFLDGKQVGVMDRRARRYRVELPARTAPARLEFLVEAMGRVNFGGEAADRKKLFAPVQVAPADGGAAAEVKSWEISALPLDDALLAALEFRSRPADGPAF